MTCKWPFDKLRAISTLLSLAGGLEQEKGTIDLSISTLFASKWLPELHDLRTINTIIPIKYNFPVNKKSIKNTQFVNHFPEKHIIHKALEWQKMLDEEEVSSLAQIAKIEGLTRARVTQIMNLLKLPVEMKEFLNGLRDPVEIRRYSERGLRKSLTGKTTF